MTTEVAEILVRGLQFLGAGLAMVGTLGAGLGIGILGSGAVQGIARNPDAAEHEVSALYQLVDVGSYSGAIFVVMFFYHKIPFVLGVSVPVILTAVPRAWPSPLKIASAM